MADLMPVDAVQQFEVALLGLPAAELVDLLSNGLLQSRRVMITVTAQPHPCTYTSTPPATSFSFCSDSGSLQVYPHSCHANN